MKAKIFKKKMMLNKRTIVNLNHPAMKDVHAGYDETQFTVCTCNTRFTCYFDETCHGAACQTHFLCPITTDPPECDTILEC